MKNEEKSNPQIKDIVFDLDETIISRQLSYVNLEKFDEKNQFKWFKDKNLHFTYSLMGNECLEYAWVIIHPGVVELIQYLLTMPDVRISFFSAGVASHNLKLVEFLLKRVLGPEKYEFEKYNFSLYSRHHCRLDLGNYKKDLTRYYDDPNNVLLFDDHQHSICPGQEKNVFLTHRMNLSNFIKNSKDDIYRANNIFLLAGVLNKALNSADYVKSMKSLSSEYNEKKWEYFQTGLALLQKINPSLSFYHPEKSLRETLLLSVTEYVNTGDQNHDFIKLLIFLGADPGESDENGLTPLLMAQYYKSHKIIDLFQNARVAIFSKKIENLKKQSDEEKSVLVKGLTHLEQIAEPLSKSSTINEQLIEKVHNILEMYDKLHSLNKMCQNFRISPKDIPSNNAVNSFELNLHRLFVAYTKEDMTTVKGLLESLNDICHNISKIHRSKNRFGLAAFFGIDARVNLVNKLMESLKSIEMDIQLSSLIKFSKASL